MIFASRKAREKLIEEEQTMIRLIRNTIRRYRRVSLNARLSGYSDRWV